jgi:hypothetical protein
MKKLILIAILIILLSGCFGGPGGPDQSEWTAKIYNVEPQILKVGDTLHITGEYFMGFGYFHDKIEPKTIIESNETNIIVVVPPDAQTGNIMLRGQVQPIYYWIEIIK